MRGHFRTFLAIGVAVALAAPVLAADLSKPITPDEFRLMPGDLLGKRLFEDTNLSEPAGVACASCHDPRTYYRGTNGSPNPAVARGSRPESLGARKVPSLLYVAYGPPFGFVEKPNDVTGKLEIVPAGGQFWDGRAADLAEQATGPLLNPREMNNPSKAAVVAKVRSSPYAGLAREVFGDDVFDDADGAFAKMSDAIASFEGTTRFKPFASKFDAWLQGTETLTAMEKRGFDLFMDRKSAGCVACHEGGVDNEYSVGRDVNAPLSRNPKNWLFTDFTYDVLGAPRNRRLPENQDARHFDLGLCARPGLAALAPPGYDVSKLCGAFKTPSLRNVAVTGPWLHNGVFNKLRDVVAFYFTRDTEPERWFPGGLRFDDLPNQHHDNVNVDQPPYDRKLGEKPRATDADIDALVAFLETLTDRLAP